MNEKIPRDLREKLIESARRMRDTPTHAEEMLWKKLRKKRLGGYRFRRQHIIQTFIVDFYCPQAKLVIEIDGSVHDNQQEYDQEREKILDIFGYQIVRFKNAQIKTELESVLARIYNACKTRIDVQ